MARARGITGACRTDLPFEGPRDVSGPRVSPRRITPGRTGFRCVTLLWCAFFLCMFSPGIFSPGTTSLGASPPESSGRAADVADGLRERGIPPLLVTGLIAMVPIFELRGAIPVGAALFKLGILRVYAVAVLFNVIPVLPILLFLSPIKRFLERKGVLKRFFGFFERRAENNRALVERYEELGLALFVAIPLPVTGAWTGALIAVILGLNPLKSFLFIAVGVAGAGLVVSVLSSLGTAGILLAAGLLLVSIALYVAAILRKREAR